jgi:hypothetical protein
MSEKHFRMALVAVAAGTPAAAALLYFLDPTAENSLYPRCFLHFLTGIHCPFCGTTRCGHSLLHGDVVQAAAWNPLSVILLPLALLWLYWCALRIVRGRPLPQFNPPLWSLRVFLGLLFIFWIIRNLPFYPCDLLAPHKL